MSLWVGGTMSLARDHSSLWIQVPISYGLGWSLVLLTSGTTDGCTQMNSHCLGSFVTPLQMGLAEGVHVSKDMKSVLFIQLVHNACYVPGTVRRAVSSPVLRELLIQKSLYIINNCYRKYYAREARACWEPATGGPNLIWARTDFLIKKYVSWYLKNEGN